MSTPRADVKAVELSWTSVSISDRSIDDLLALLDLREQRRAERFRVADARRRFVTARAMARCLLGRRLGVPPCSLVVKVDARGKPALESDLIAPHFNLAHSGDVAVVAIANRELGVDVEELRPISRADRLAARFFSDSERRWLSALPEECRDRGFLELWTCKEAYLKAVGTGIELPLTLVEVDPDLPVLNRTPDGDSLDWTLLRAELPTPATCVVAIRGSGWRMDVTEFDWSSVRVES